jgi:hypothetical protein
MGDSVDGLSNIDSKVEFVFGMQTTPSVGQIETENILASKKGCENVQAGRFCV